ncbi:MAG: carboxylating nicotinate-nucleotide diphosphorylase [Gammaproteobacteria bacterium]|nr:carboxylating nicotinate-nucleotide diphosphorylase [Gammaproteobacteria bacterium]
MTPKLPDISVIQTNVKTALAEDLGSGDGSGDVSASLINNHQLSATIIVREAAVICGQRWAEEVFQQLSDQVEIQWHINEAEQVNADTLICSLTGPAHALLSGERCALNFLQTLSGTATATRQLVNELSGTNTQLLDTRKTIPGLRLAQKYAVTCGGGVNHRLGLYDAYLIKENHILAAGGIAKAVSHARTKNPTLLLEVEVENLNELQQAIQAKVDRVLLDNFSLDDLKTAVKTTQGQLQLEASGGIENGQLKKIAATGVDYISVGAITKHLKATDFSMRFKETSSD